jgi:hypothetical protein
MKQPVSVAGVILSIIAAALFASMSARASDRRSAAAGDEGQATETSDPATESDADQSSEPDSSSDAIIDIEGDTDPDADMPKAAPPTAKELFDGLVAVSPGSGVQLPAPTAADHPDWQTVTVGFASMRVPGDWTIQNQIGKPGDEDQTIGLSPPSNDIYVELRHIQNADSNYMNTPLDLTISDYRSTPDRLKDGITFGFQPMVIAGAVGYVETMNQFGKDKNDDGTPTFRMINWRGRWEQNDAIQKVEFGATFAQDGYDTFAPLVSEILATIKIDAGDSTQ